MKTNKRSITDTFIIIIFGLLTFVPLTAIGNMIRIAVAGAAFLIKMKTPSHINRLDRLFILIFISLGVSIVTVLIFELNNFAFNTVLHEIARFLFIIAVLSVVSKLNVKFKYVYRLLVFILLVNFAVQILQYLRVDAVYSFIKTYYVVDRDGFTHLDLMYYSGGGFRAGSIFINPNIYMVIPVVSIAAFYQQKKIKDSILNNIFIICAIASALLTGSRTAIVIIAVVVLMYYNLYTTNGFLKIFIFVSAAALVVFLSYQHSIDSRALEIDQLDSLWVKFKSFLWYWKSTLSIPIYWLTGSLGSSIATGMDSEWGHIYSWYGILGIIWYVKYYKIMAKCNKHLKVFSNAIVIATALAAATASVLLSMQLSTLICAISLAKLTTDDDLINNSLYKE